MVGMKWVWLRAKLQTLGLHALTREDRGNQRIVTFPQHIHNTWWQGVTVLLEESCGVIFNLRKSIQNQIQERDFSRLVPTQGVIRLSPHTIRKTVCVEVRKVASLRVEKRLKLHVGKGKTSQRWLLFFTIWFFFFDAELFNREMYFQDRLKFKPN